jgi:hypothetical protein
MSAHVPVRQRVRSKSVVVKGQFGRVFSWLNGGNVELLNQLRFSKSQLMAIGSSRNQRRQLSLLQGESWNCGKWRYDRGVRKPASGALVDNFEWCGSRSVTKGTNLDSRFKGEGRWRMKCPMVLFYYCFWRHLWRLRSLFMTSHDVKIFELSINDVNRGLWWPMDSIHFHPGPPYPTLLHCVGARSIDCRLEGEVGIKFGDTLLKNVFSKARSMNLDVLLFIFSSSFLMS